MRILFFIESMHAGGKERRLLELIKGLLTSNTEYDIHIVLMNNEIHYEEVESLNVTIHYLLRRKKRDIMFFRRFVKLAKSIKPEIIHVWGNMPAIYAIPAKLRFGIPMINNEITDAPIKVQGGILSHRLSFPFSDVIVANTLAGLKAYNTPKKKSKYIYNGFNFSRLEKLRSRKEVLDSLDIKTPFIIGMIATFSDKKDYTTYFKAAQKIIKERQDITFLAIGAGDSTRYNQYIDGKLIKIIGAQKNVESIMNCCDIGVLISKVENHGEGISNALMEFMALGKPVIATRNGGNPELIDHEKDGYLVNPSDEYDLGNRINLLIQDNKLRQNMSVSAKAKIESKFSIDQMIKSFEDIYNDFKRK